MTFLAKLFIVSLFLTLTSYSFSQAKETVRFDGFYQTVSEIDSTNDTTYIDTTYSFLRFYPNGKVLSVSSNGNLNDLKKWFNLKHENPSIGNYEINDDRIYFETTSNQGSVVYDGQIKDKYYLDLSVKSLINGNLSQKKYYFVKVIGLK
jgi:hypothetical protein